MVRRTVYHFIKQGVNLRLVFADKIRGEDDEHVAVFAQIVGGLFRRKPVQIGRRRVPVRLRWVRAYLFALSSAVCSLVCICLYVVYRAKSFMDVNKSPTTFNLPADVAKALCRPEFEQWWVENSMCSWFLGIENDTDVDLGLGGNTRARWWRRRYRWRISAALGRPCNVVLNAFVWKEIIRYRCSCWCCSGVRSPAGYVIYVL